VGKVVHPNMIVVGRSFDREEQASKIAQTISSSVFTFCCHAYKGINSIRNHVKEVAKLSQPKVILFHDADLFTDDAQIAMRRIMEEHSTSTRFIFEVESLTAVNTAIKSRCVTVYAPPDPHSSLSKEAMVSLWGTTTLTDPLAVFERAKALQQSHMPYDVLLAFIATVEKRRPSGTAEALKKSGFSLYACASMRCSAAQQCAFLSSKLRESCTPEDERH